MVEKLVPDLFIKHKNLAYLSVNILKYYKEIYQNILKLRSWTLVYTLYEAFIKTKRGMQLALLPHFLHNIWRKIFLTLHSINWPNFIVWLSLLLEILGNICIVIICCPVCDVINFGINLLIKLFFYRTKISRQKYLKNEKSF